MLSLLRSFQFFVDNSPHFYLPVPVHLGIFQKTCTGVHIDFFLVEPHFLLRPLCLDTVIWRFSGYRMDFGCGNRVSNCRSWDFLLFPTRDWCAWIVPAFLHQSSQSRNELEYFILSPAIWRMKEFENTCVGVTGDS